MNKDKYTSPCYYHKCKEYSSPEKLIRAIENINKSQNKKIGSHTISFPYIKLLTRLGILESTAEHWATCKPNNILALERARLECDVSIFNSISQDPKLVFEAWKITRKESLESPKPSESKLPLSNLGDNEEFK